MNEILLDLKAEAAVERAQDLRIDTIRDLSIKAKLEIIQQEDKITEKMIDDLIYDSGLTLRELEYYQEY